MYDVNHMIKSIGAVVAGIITIVLLSVVTDMLLEAYGFFPPPNKGLFYTNLLVIALFYRTVYAAFGGYVTEKLAPSKPMKHVTVLLVIGTILGLLGVIGGWNLSQHWYPISLVVTSGLAVWLGGKMGSQKKNKS